MSRSVNKTILLGNLGNDPEIRMTQGGTKVAKLSLATSYSRKVGDGQWEDEVQWHRVTAWDKTADFLEQYARKGDRVYVDGRLEYSQTEKDGVTRYWTDIVAREVILLGGAGAGGQDAKPQGSAPPPASSSTEDDLPF